MNNDVDQSKVDNDLADRLDTLFDETESAEPSNKRKGPAEDPLDTLKSLVMSIEWEITDDVMERFLSQINAVKTRFAEDRILVMFLQLLGSLGLYVKTNKGKAHPSAFKLLNSVYAGFEKSAVPGSISPSEKKKLLYIELNKYKELKEQIESTREPEPPRMAGAPGDGGEAASLVPARPLKARTEAASTQRALEEAVADLKTSILKELAAIRNDIARLSTSR